MKTGDEDCYLLPHLERGIVWGYSVRGVVSRYRVK